MATVTGFTAARSLEIENTSVVGGRVDANKHLILTTKAGTDIDAGLLPPGPTGPAGGVNSVNSKTGNVTLNAADVGVVNASMTVKGIVELATTAEVQAGTDNTRVVTPLGLAGLSGYRLLSIMTITSNTTFVKADYPGLKLVRVRAIGGGGAGGGSVAGAANQSSSGGGGGGGGYAEGLRLASDLAASVSVTIGYGGSGITGNPGNDGGQTNCLGVTANGGSGGSTRPSSNLFTAAQGGQGGGGSSTYGFSSRGGRGSKGNGYATLGQGGDGGQSVFGAGGQGAYSGSSNGYTIGGSGDNYGGGGGGGASNAGGLAVGGGAGASGIAIVEIYV